MKSPTQEDIDFHIKSLKSFMNLIESKAIPEGTPMAALSAQVALMHQLIIMLVEDIVRRQ